LFNGNTEPQPVSCHQACLFFLFLFFFFICILQITPKGALFFFQTNRLLSPSLAYSPALACLSPNQPTNQPTNQLSIGFLQPTIHSTSLTFFSLSNLFLLSTFLARVRAETWFFSAYFFFNYIL
jgi:hypothetical protein